MFKRNIFKYILVAFAFVFVFLTSCKGANPIVSIQVNNQSEEAPITFVVGEFSFEGLSLAVNYENGETKQVSVTEEMINKDDLIKLYKLGKNEIEVIYEREKTSMFVYGTYKQFTDLYLNDVTMTYTGDEIKVEVEGNVPDTAKIIYPQGNTYKNVGTYVTKAVVFENGYEVLELSANVVITKATYDMSLISFTDAEYTYDGRDKMIVVQGKLPAGVSVTYSIDGLTTTGISECGKYEVTASFKGDYKNYEVIEDKKATLTINKAVHNMDGIRLEDAEFEYDGTEHVVKLTNEVLLPNGVSAKYTNNRQTEAGVYEVMVEFIVEDETNYEAIEPLTATLTINKAQYDLSNYYLLSIKEKYDASKTHQAQLNSDVLEFIKVEYNYYVNNSKGSWNELTIDTTNGYWYKKGSSCILVGKGTVIKLNTDEYTTVTLEALNDVNNFEISVDDGVTTITCLEDDGLKLITVTNSLDQAQSRYIDVTTCDLIFFNENEALPKDVLPSLKGEYIVVARLVVEDNNYYGEKELTAFMIIE